MPETLVGRDVFLRHTDVNGKASVQCHRTWDAERFIASQQAAAAKVNAEQKDGQPRRARVEQITEDQFRNERFAK